MKVYIAILFVVLSAIFQMLTPLKWYTENFIVAMGSLACAALFILSHFDDKFKHYQH